MSANSLGKKLSIIIPVCNEAKTIEEVVRRVQAVSFPLDYEIIIVDDHSSDETFQITYRLSNLSGANKIYLFQNEVNQGKGSCIQKGLKYCTGDLMIVQDADFEYNPADIPRLIETLAQDGVGAVYGSRFLGVKRPQRMTFLSWIANCFLTWFTNFLYGVRLTDMETCYKLIRIDSIRDLVLKAKRFGFEPEITAKLIKRGIRIQEIPIFYNGRSVKEGKKIKPRDFFVAVWILISQRLNHVD